jgi:RND family efflux transporter MFP subunit
MTNATSQRPPQAREPQKRRVVPVAIVCFVLVIGLSGTWLLRHSEASENQVALADEPKGVTVVEARATQFRERRRYIGTLEPWQSAQVGPQLTSGFVDTVLVRPGQHVKRGEVVATLDCRNASAENRALSAQARALEERRKANAREAARLSELSSGGYVSPNELEQKRAAVSAAQAQIQAVLAQASGKSLLVDDCVLRAPFAGEVAARFVDPGAFVRPGTPVAQLVDRSMILLTADVPEIDFDAVAPQTPITIKLLAANKTVEAVIARRSPAADMATRTVHFEVDLADNAQAIPVGTTAEIHVEVGQPIAATEIPLLAAKIRGTGASIFSVIDDIARKKDLTLLGERGANIYVARAQLAPGTLVVTQGRQLLATNDRVSAKLDAPPPTAAAAPLPVPGAASSTAARGER